jgi:AAA domain
MNQKDLRPARDFAINFGVKAVIYGPPGSGKTPVINTAPRPVLLACEPGLLSMRGSNVPTWEGYTPKRIDEFFEWVFGSTETKNFDTICVDSTSHMAEIYLDAALNGKSKSGQKMHGLAAYGEMARNTLEHLETLYYVRQKHTYLIAKQEIINENGLTLKRPYYSGKELPVKLPHKFDQILQLDIQNVPGVGQVKAFRCQASIDVSARDRTGMLAEFEPPNFTAIVQKAMS